MLVAPPWITDIGWRDANVSVDLTPQAVKGAPTGGVPAQIAIVMPRVKPSNAAFAAMYAVLVPRLMRALTDEIITMRPQPRVTMPAAALRHRRRQASSAESKGRRQLSSLVSRKSPLTLDTALLSRMSG